jgi:hypothetical protein
LTICLPWIFLALHKIQYDAMKRCETINRQVILTLYCPYSAIHIVNACRSLISYTTNLAGLQTDKTHTSRKHMWVLLCLFPLLLYKCVICVYCFGHSGYLNCRTFLNKIANKFILSPPFWGSKLAYFPNVVGRPRRIVGENLCFFGETTIASIHASGFMQCGPRFS